MPPVPSAEVWLLAANAISSVRSGRQREGLADKNGLIVDWLDGGPLPSGLQPYYSSLTQTMYCWPLGSRWPRGIGDTWVLKTRNSADPSVDSTPSG